MKVPMKTLLKFGGLALLSIAGLLWAESMSPDIQLDLLIVGMGLLIINVVEADARSQNERLKKIEAMLNEIKAHPLNTQYIADGIEGLIDDRAMAKRAALEA
jgi:hypothetical protein